MNPEPSGLHTHYTLVCDDIRVEVGNRLSLIGVFQAVATEQLPATLIKLATLTYWHGEGAGFAEVRVVSPDRSEVVVASSPTRIELSAGGYTQNVTYFVNVHLHQAGTYWVQTVLDSEVIGEVPFAVVLNQRDSV